MPVRPWLRCRPWVFRLVCLATARVPHNAFQLVGIDNVVAEAGPEQKLQEVITLQAAGNTVAMVGDGLNDGPVLARANTSFALGTAAPLAQAQSDFVIQGGNVLDVVKSLTQARKTLIIVKQNLISGGRLQRCQRTVGLGWFHAAVVGRVGYGHQFFLGDWQCTQIESRGRQNKFFNQGELTRGSTIFADSALSGGGPGHHRDLLVGTGVWATGQH